MKKVFSREKCIEYMTTECGYSKRMCENSEWVKECDGLTKNECLDLHYLVADKWMIEVEEER